MESMAILRVRAGLPQEMRKKRKKKGEWVVAEDLGKRGSLVFELPKGEKKSKNKQKNWVEKK